MVAHKIDRENVINVYKRYGPSYDVSKLSEFTQASFREVISQQNWEFWEVCGGDGTVFPDPVQNLLPSTRTRPTLRALHAQANATVLDDLLAEDIQSRFDRNTVTILSVSVLSLENSDKTLSVEREKVARLSAGTRFHEVQATNDAARFRTEHLALVNAAERAETERKAEAERSLAALQANHTEDHEQVSHNSMMQQIRNNQSIADADARLEVARKEAEMRRLKVFAEYGSHENYVAVEQARIIAESLKGCPHTLDQQNDGFSRMLSIMNDGRSK